MFCVAFPQSYHHCLSSYIFVHYAETDECCTMIFVCIGDIFATTDEERVSKSSFLKLEFS